MDTKTLKGKLQVAGINYDATGIPSSVARLKPTLYNEGNSYVAWFEDGDTKYYGFGGTPEAAMQDFDRHYQSLRPKPPAVEPPQVVPQEPVFIHAFEGVQQWFNHRIKSYLLKYFH